jgi:membrane-bound serine protease (ClpP class)
MRRGLFLGAVLAALAAAPLGAEEPRREATVYTVSLDDAIHPITARYFKEALRRANDDRAALLILELNTPGGLQTSMEEMITSITSSRVPVVVFVNGSKAASAGFFLTIAADVAVMAPGTRIGAAHPVALLGDVPKDSPMMAKIENDAAAYARSLAANRGRNAKAAEEAVRKSSAYTEQEALRLGLVDHVCHDEAEILRVLDGKTIRRFDGSRETLRLSPARIVSLDMTARERLLSTLANPSLALLLLFAGVVGLYVEFTHPGMIAPGVIGGICLLLFALATQTLPVNWVGVALVGLGILLFLIELKVPSYGTLTAGGIACLVLGSLMLFRAERGVPGLEAARWTIISISATAGVIMAILTTLVVRAVRLRPTTGAAGLLTEEGRALTAIDPEGRVFVHGEYWNARSSRPIPSGARVRITGVRDLLLEVEEIPS